MSARSCQVCGREALDGWKLCPGCGSKLPPVAAGSEARGGAAHQAASRAGTTSPPAKRRTSPTGTLGTAARIGSLFGFVVAMIIGLFLVFAAAVSPVPDYEMAAFLAFLGLVFLVLCALLGLAALLTDFFPALGAMFSWVGLAAAVISLVISAKNWNEPGSVASVAWFVEFLLCYLILRVISPRMSRQRGDRRTTAAVPRRSGGHGLSHYIFGAILGRPDL